MKYMAIIQGNFGRKAKKNNKNDVKEKKPGFLYQFHVSLAFSEPLIWRRIQVPGQINLQQFHKVLQICLGWSGEYSHQFYVGKIFYEMSSSSGEEKKYDEAKFELQSLEEAMRWCFTYLYDAGEGWEHDIVLEETRPQKNGETHPVLLDGAMASPPEEVAGVHLYGEIIEALQDPSSLKNKTTLLHYGLEDFDPDCFDGPTINKVLAKGAWSA